MLFPAASVHTLAGISTVTVPFAVGVILTVYVVPDPEILLTVPFPTVTSPDSKPVTDSLKVTVIGMGDVFVSEDSVELIDTFGFSSSPFTMIVNSTVPEEPWPLFIKSSH